MKKIGAVVGDLYHRHYIDDAFATFKAAQGSNRVLVITYCSYEYLVDALEFLTEHVFPHGKSHRIILGLAGIGDGRNLNTKALQAELTTIIDRIPPTVELFLHVACHIKMLSYDSITVIGSQNISSTSLALSERERKKYKYHEAQIEITDNNQALASALFDETLKNPSLYTRVSQQSVASRVSQALISGAKAEGEKQKIKLARDLGELMKCEVAIPKCLNLHPSVENNKYFIEAMIKFYNTESPDQYDVDEIYRVIYADRDDYPAGKQFTDYVYKITQLVGMTDDSTFPQKNAVISVFRAVYSNRLGFADESDFDAFREAVVRVVEDHYATHKKELILKHQHTLVQRIIENPGSEQAIAFCRDDEGGLMDYCIREALESGRIDIDRYLKDMDFSAYIWDVHKLFMMFYHSGLERAFSEVHSAYDNYSEAYEREILNGS